VVIKIDGATIVTGIDGRFLPPMLPLVLDQLVGVSTSAIAKTTSKRLGI